MADTLQYPLSSDLVAARESVSVREVPWYIWCALLAITSANFGGQWDIAWHMTIGRDTFWTPAHLAIYLCGVLAGVTSAYLILFSGRHSVSGATVGIWGFRGPLGAFVMAWGGVTMLISAPFDDWWHNAYGLDVKILSPPHVVLMLGMGATLVGTLLLVLGFLNRASEGEARVWRLLLLYIGGMLLVMRAAAELEYASRTLMHSALFYYAACLGFPSGFAMMSRAARHKWASTIVAAIYTIFLLGFLWIIPLFPAEPKLGPVYQPVTHFVPASGFPLLLLAPAIAMDLVFTRWRCANKWLLALFAGTLFLAVLLVTQWPFADFLMSPLSRNPVFGTHYLGYYVSPNSFAARNQFNLIEKTRLEFGRVMGMALVASVLTTRLGLALGDWMRKVQR